jgi:ABC-type Mn2+/Zn2+ transport system permease subunit
MIVGLGWCYGGHVERIGVALAVAFAIVAVVLVVVFLIARRANQATFIVSPRRMRQVAALTVVLGVVQVAFGFYLLLVAEDLGRVVVALGLGGYFTVAAAFRWRQYRELR